MDSDNRFNTLTAPVGTTAAQAAGNCSNESPHSVCTVSTITINNELRESSSPSQGSSQPQSFSIPNGIQMAAATPNESQAGRTRPGLNYASTNSRPPGSMVNLGYEHDSPQDLKDSGLPSYEEAIRAMDCKPNPYHYGNSDGHYHQHHHPPHPDHGQFGAQDQYFYPHVYQQSVNSDFRIDFEKSLCKHLFTFVIILFLLLAMKIFFVR